MNDIFSLIVAAYHFKKSVRQCLKEDKNSNEYILANSYHEYFKQIGSNMSKPQIDTMMEKINADKIKYSDSNKISMLANTTVELLSILDNPKFSDNIYTNCARATNHA